MKLTPEEFAVLKRGCFTGTRPGSNAWPLVELELDDVTVPGEVIDGLIRKGYFAPNPRENSVTLPARPDNVAEFDIDVDFDYRITEAGKAALEGGE